MNNIKLSGKISFIWVLALAVIIYTGYRMVTDAKETKNAAAQVFTEQGSYPSANTAIMDLLG